MEEFFYLCIPTNKSGSRSARLKFVRSPHGTYECETTIEFLEDLETFLEDLTEKEQS